ncbi:MAG: DNA repair protein RecN [Gammaproteobacteria bacterium]|nr:DNA repair protein RecN [Gammaproteobacteria bacterium]
MLSRIYINNLAIVTELEIDFNFGMSALTGETGAGKSILLGALGMTLGDRADNGMIGTGGDRAEITAVFNLQQLPSVNDWLAGQGLEEDMECMVRRVLIKEGTSRAYINGTPVPVKTLQSLGEQLIDIHGQHAHQRLMKRDHQRDLLDQYADCKKCLSQTASNFAQWQQAEQELESLRTAAKDRETRLDLLRYQKNELSALAVETDELSRLNQEYTRLNSADRLMAGCGELVDQLYDNDGSAHQVVNHALAELNELLPLAPNLESCREMLENTQIQLQESATELREYSDNLELNPERLEQVNQRIADIQDMARKYRCKPDELGKRLVEIEQELQQLEQADIQLEKLDQQRSHCRQVYLKGAEKLDLARQNAAQTLSKTVTDSIQTLGMPDGNVKVEVTQLPEERATAHGLNRVEVLVSANTGHPMQPLAKVASGGELSRIGLAIQVATSQCKSVPTLIFDEVDAGIGGGVAEIVGRLLRTLGEQRQILCVTHLPQVAALAHNHLYVKKQANGKGTRTEITTLQGGARIEEIARMLGGVEITAPTRAHAKEMLGNL